MRSTSERREAIISKLKEFGSVAVIHLAEEFEVSKVTIRNDLDYLERKNLLVRSHGGAIQKPADITDATNKLKSLRYRDEKMRIANGALAYLNSGDALVLGAGTTTEEVARLIKGVSPLFVLTNGLNIISSIEDSDDVCVVGTGGNFHKDSMSFYGSLAEESIEKYSLDKMIIGIDGLDIHAGITTHSEHEVRFYHAMMKATKECIVVADSSKFGKVSVHKIMQCSNIHTLITDSNISQEYRDYLTDLNINLVIV